jgi:hypothetical protein
MPRFCSFCDQPGHNIRTCDSDEYCLLARQFRVKQHHSIQNSELPTYEHCTFIQWLFSLTSRELKALNSYYLSLGDNADRYVKIARLAMHYSDAFPYHTVIMLYTHPEINVRHADTTQKQLIENIWIRMRENGMDYQDSKDIALRQGNRIFSSQIGCIDFGNTEDQMVRRFDYDTALQELAWRINTHFNVEAVRPNHTPLYEPDTNLIYQYLGYGITYEFVQRFCPNIRELRIDALRYNMYRFREFEDGEVFEDVIQKQVLNILFDTAPQAPSTEDPTDPTDAPAPAPATTTTTECCICYECPTDTTFNCKHEYCGDCVFKLLQTMFNNHTIKPVCPYCRTNITQVICKDSEMTNKMTMAFNANDL